MTNLIPIAFRLAARDLRGGLRGFAIFVACLTLGVAAIAGVGSVSASIIAGIRADARSLLGGDVELRLVHRTASAEQRQAFEASGTLSAVVSMRAMARRADGERRTLIELKAVDDQYPLYGAVQLGPPLPLDELLARRNGLWGAAVDPLLLERLGLNIGDRMRIGEAELEVRSSIVREPDIGGTAFILGPRVMIAGEALASTGLIQPGALVNYDYRVRLAPGTDARRWIGELKARFPDAGWRIRDFGDAAPSVQRFLDRIGLFLTLVGLTALLVGGIGVGNAVRSYLAGKTAAIATLKCLGAPGGLVFQTYLIEVLALAALSIVLGLAIGAASPVVVAELVAAKLPVAARLGIYPAPLAMAALFGTLVTLAFTLWPLGRAREIAPADLFRAEIATATARAKPRYAVAIGLIGAALAALAIYAADDRRIAIWYVGSAIAALLCFRVAALGAMWIARRFGQLRRPSLRLAFANLYRPGAATPSVVVSLGLGLTVLVAIGLIQGNLEGELRGRVMQGAPSYFFVDIQPDQAAEFDRLVAATPGVTAFERVPSLRGRITRLRGVPVEQAGVAPEAQWAIRSDRGLTYSAAPPAGSRVVAGSWWQQDYSGPPLVSFDQELAKGMGLNVGDSIGINVLGREITARIANLRSIDWTSMGINFTLVFAPGTLEAAPQTFLATAHAAPANEETLQRVVTDRFPNVSAIRVRDALAAVSRIFDSIGDALRVTAGISIAAGTLVLAGSIAAGHRRRVYDAVVLKVLGATRWAILRTFLIEYGLLGLLTATIAAGFGTLAAYLVLTQIMRAEWNFLPSVVVGTSCLATLLTIGFGFLGTWRALGVKAAPMLRNE